MKRTRKQEKEFQEQLKKDRRNHYICCRTNEVRDCLFLIIHAANRLRGIDKYFDCSQNPDFDDLFHNVKYGLKFIEFAQEQLEEISERDLEMGIHPSQYNGKSNTVAKRTKARSKSNEGKSESV